MEAIVTTDHAGQIKAFVPGYGDISEDVARELHALRMEAFDREAAVVDRRQRYLARECGESVHMDGGTIVGQIDEAVYQHYVDRYGPKFFSDKSNRRWFLKRHPECAVQSRAANPTFRVTQLPAYREPSAQ